MKIAACVLCVAGLTSAALAEPEVPKTYTGQGGALVDRPSSEPFGTSIFSITVPSDPDGTNEVYSVVDVRLDITHSYVGDLVIRLRHEESGTVATLLDRPGYPELTFGNWDNLDGVYIFEDDQPLIPEDRGDTDDLIAPGVYGPSGPGFLWAFEGVSKAGTWSLIIEDHAGGDSGTLRSWSFTIYNIPAPGAAGLLAVAGLAAARRRR